MAALFLLIPPTLSDITFAISLEECISNHAKRVAETFPEWGNSCMAPTA
jgi:hypothetical protein